MPDRRRPREVPAFAPLLADLDLAGVVVTADALQTHHEAAEFLVTSKRAHYLFTVKATVALWIAAGASPKEVAARAGHTSVKTELDVYGGLYPDAAEGQVLTLDRGASGPKVVPDSG